MRELSPHYQQKFKALVALKSNRAIREAFGREVRKIREQEIEVGAASMAEKLGMSPETYRNFEDGRGATIETYAAFCAIYKLDFRKIACTALKNN